MPAKVEKEILGFIGTINQLRFLKLTSIICFNFTCRCSIHH
ncbi:hypothetical protein ES708_06853 [subsurface metagenome]